MPIKLKNYTTEVSALRSIDLIEKSLIDFGASNIMKEYDQGKARSLSFIVEVEGMKLPFKVPANIGNVAKWLRKQKPNAADKTIQEQAERIAWKQQYEIIYLQLSQIEMTQLEKLEVFFPYLYDVANQKTYYQKIKEGKFKALLPPSTT